MTGWALQHGDCRALMAAMDAASIDSIVTDPPYELGFMGRAWDRSGIAVDVALWRAALRVVKPGGYLIAFAHARTYHRMVCAIEDAGFEIRDQIMWLYGSAMPKGGVRDGRGTCLKPAHEPIVVARRPLIGTVAANLARYGTGAMNIDACRIASADANPSIARRQGSTAHLSNRPACETEAEGRMASRQTPDAFRAARPGEALGRWPANVVHDGSDDACAGFPVTDRRVVPQVRVQAKARSATATVYGQDNRIRTTPGYADHGSAARYFYCAKASRADRDIGGVGNTHPTVKPTALMRWLVRLFTPENGLVLDPFAGSGSTGRAALLEGRRFVGCELTDAYLPIARARIADAAGMAS